jgi:aspartate-semialdehyde dehydrogenase
MMNMKKYNVVVVGAGIVGKEMVEILLERNFPCKGLPRILATREREELVAGKTFYVERTEVDSFNNVDIALFAGTEGEKGASKLFGWEAVKKGAVVIDNGGDFRMDSDVPLVIPEINPHHLKNHKGFIANPNCSTIQMLMAIFPIYKQYGIKNLIVSTYQAVSGTGKKALKELEEQVSAYFKKDEMKNEVYPYQIAFNVIPEIGSLSEEFHGYYTEEVKMIKETRKILDEPEMKISATCVRVPVFNGHSESITVQCERKPDVNHVRNLLAAFPDVKVIDEPEKSLYPTPLLASGKDRVFVGRIRENTALENALDIWAVSDNIRKGAALNAVQIAEEMLKMELL